MHKIHATTKCMLRIERKIISKSRYVILDWSYSWIYDFNDVKIRIKVSYVFIWKRKDNQVHFLSSRAY